MKKDNSVQGEGRVLEKTLESLDVRKKAPRGVFILLLLLYIILSVPVKLTAGSQEVIAIGGRQVPLTAFTGVFSTVSNLCIIMMAVFYGKTGFIASVVVLLIQYPMILQSIILRGNYSSIPGLFGNFLTIVVVILIYINNKRIEKYQRRLREQATTDLLTGLPNTFASTELVGKLIKENKPFATVSIDVNGINSINNSLGYDMGNKVLIEVASRWKQTADEGRFGTLDFISRINGDEFSLIVRGFNSGDELENTIEQYSDDITRKINIDGYEFSLNGSFGYAIFPYDSDRLDSLLSYSYAAMREIKRLNNGEHILRFSNELLTTHDQLIIENKVRDALEHDRIFFNLQPQYDMSHRLRGFETLARMKDGEGNLINPDEFIPAAERLGLISDIDRAVHKKVASFFSRLIKKSGADITLSINVSAKHLMRNDFIEEMRDFLENSGISVYQIEVEITESVFIDSVEKAARCLSDLKDLGVKIAIDDFGTGYSSLSYLNSFPSDILKIDKSFIDEMNTNETSQRYVKAIISLAHVMDLEVVAEGVEEPEQLETLRDINCDYIQGFLWGRPLSEEEAEKLVMAGDEG